MVNEIMIDFYKRYAMNGKNRPEDALSLCVAEHKNQETQREKNILHSDTSFYIIC